jgi:serine/threonine protein kinase
MSADDGRRSGHDTAPDRPHPRSTQPTGAAAEPEPTAVMGPTELEQADTMVGEEPAEGDQLFEATGFDERYRRGKLLGVGGMGEVRMFADRLTGRTVAMKTVRAAIATEQGQRRFAREVRIQAQLEHPSVVPVYDVGVSADGAMYFTMKRLRGESLSTVLKKLRDGSADPRWTLRKLLTVLSTVAMTLEFAHRRGVLHRDLKPNNIMLGEFDEVYVIDWGLADVRAPVARGDTRTPLTGLPVAPRVPAGPGTDLPLIDSSMQPDTGVGHVLGTPGYVAPEGCDPDLPDGLVDHRADIYALGVILFEVLTLQKLHVGSDVSAVLESTIHIDGASPRTRAPKREIPPELDALCFAATRLDPAARPATAGEIARRIETYLDGDRDLEQRRTVGRERAEAAAATLSGSRNPGVDEHQERSRALREVVGALALDPESTLARETLLRLFTEPSEAANTAAAAAHHDLALERLRLAGRNHVFVMMTYLIYLPIVLWMGVRSWPMLGAVAASIVGCIGGTFWLMRHPPRDLRLPLWHLALSTLATTIGVVVLGPIVMVPAIVIATGVGYIATFGDRWGVVVAAMLTPILLPIGLQIVGLIDPWFVFADGEIHLRAWMVELSPTPTLLLIVITHVAIITAALFFVGRVRRAQLDAERRLQLHSWQLSQLVPEDTRKSITG